MPPPTLDPAAGAHWGSPPEPSIDACAQRGAGTGVECEQASKPLANTLGNGAGRAQATRGPWSCRLVMRCQLHDGWIMAPSIPACRSRPSQVRCRGGLDEIVGGGSQWV